MQNWPNRFSDATLSPFGNTVTCVVWLSSLEEAYLAGGMPGKGEFKGGCWNEFRIGGPALEEKLFHDFLPGHLQQHPKNN